MHAELADRFRKNSKTREGATVIVQPMEASEQWNKGALNTTQDVMGFPAAMRYGIEACTLLDATDTPEYHEFDCIRRSTGLGDALKWRDDVLRWSTTSTA